MFIDKKQAQLVFDKGTSGVISQAKPSFIGNSLFDSSVSYLSCREGKILKCPIGHLLSNEQINKYEITPAKFIDVFPDELISEMLPNSGTVCARRFLSKLQRAHTLAYVAHKKSKEKTDFVADFIINSNEVAKYFSLKEIK